MFTARNPVRRLLPGLALALAAVATTGCASPGSMSPEQKAAYELRRYCEQHPGDTVKCLGFLGFH